MASMQEERKPHALVEGKILYLEAVRVFAILCVMFTHSGSRGSNYYQYTSSTICYIWSLALELLSDVGVPLFFMVSGVLLLKKEEPVKDIYIKRIPRIAIVLCFFSFIRYLYECFVVTTMTFSMSEFIRLLWTGTLFLPFWYLYTYFGILLVVPFLRRMVRGMNKEEGWLFLLLCVVFNIVVPFINGITGSAFNLSLYMESSLVYMLTGYILEYVISIKTSRKVIIVSAVITIVVFIALMFDGLFRGKLLYPVVVSVFLVIQSIRWERNNIISVAFVKLGSCTFGLYLIEDYLRNLFAFIYDNLADKITPIFANAVWLAIVFITGILIVSLMKKVPVLKKYI